MIHDKGKQFPIVDTTARHFESKNSHTQIALFSKKIRQHVEQMPFFENTEIPWRDVQVLDHILKVLYSPYVNKAFVYIFVSKILSFIRQLFIFSSF
jgi:hypothetical protein